MAAPVTIHFFRHGDKDGDRLTPQGRDQALDAGRELRKTVPKNAVVKMYASPTVRTQQTGDYITEGLGPDRRVRVPRVRKKLEIAPLSPTGMGLYKALGQDKYIEMWLKGLLPKEAAEPAVEKAAKMRRQTVEFAARLNRSFAALPWYKRAFGRRPVHLVYVTHQGNLEALAMSLTGKGFEELGGGSGHLEHLAITVPVKGGLKVEYKGRAHEALRRE